ncbi:MAG TPA: aspartate--tRNA(Asn) ligase [Rectinemataceae bacterium]|nr:aspartate--tRNA(Asn) ligase [Rectinemataceae bacterium]
MRTLVRDVKGLLGQRVELCGWVHRIREMGQVSFILLRDRSGIVQLVVQGGAGFTVESVIRVQGEARAQERAPGGVEIEVASIEQLASAESPLPIQVNGKLDQSSLESVLDNRMISIRNPKILSIFRLQSDILDLFAAHLRSEGFTEIKTSKIIGTGTEGGTGLFELDYFGRKAFLAQSPQFYKQAMVASGLERVFEIGAAYRAEKHDTPRHLNEYISLDVELAFIDTEKDLIGLEKRLLAAIFGGLAVRDEAILGDWGAGVPDPASVEAAPTVSYDEALEIVARTGSRIYELNPEAERILCEWSAREHGSDLVFVNDFPRKLRPFYAFPKGSGTQSFDCLFRGLEITTGGRRINDYPMILESCAVFGLDPASIADYLSIFKYGCPPHGGFAIGLERLTQKILGLPSVKAAALFPRDRRRTAP